MRRLQVEELEPRQLLSGAGFSHQPSPAPHHAADAVDGGGHPSAVGGDHGGRTGPDGSGMGRRETGPSQRPTAPCLEGRAPTAPGAPAPETSSGVRRDSLSAAAQVDLFFQTVAPAVVGPTAAAATPGASPAAERAPGAGPSPPGPESAGGGPAAEGTTEAAPESPAVPTPRPGPTLGNLFVAASLLLELRGVTVALLPTGGEPAAERLLTAPLPSSPGGPTPLSGGRAAPAGRGEDVDRGAPQPPIPQAPGLLASPRPRNLPALDAALRQFLDGLERMRQGLAGEPEGSGLWLWLVAGTAAATACEIARRQMRRPPDPPDETGSRLSGPFLDIPPSGG
jgi:hypothetical protein